MKYTFCLIVFCVSSIFLYSQTIEVSGTVKTSTDRELVFHQNSKNPLTGNLSDKRYKTQIGPDGNFKIELPLNAIEEWTIMNNGNFILLDMVPGTRIHLDIQQFAVMRGFTATGSNADDINFAPALLSDSLYESVYRPEAYGEDIQNKNFASILSKRKAKMEYEVTFLERYRETHQMSDGYYRWKKTQFNYIPEEQLIFDLMQGGGFRSGSVIDSSSYALLDEQGLNDDYAAWNCYQYNDIVNSYLLMKMNHWQFRPTSFNSLYEFGKNDLQGKTRQVYLTGLMSSITNTELYDSAFAYYIHDVNDPRLISVVREQRQEYLQAVAKSKVSLENVSQSKSLNEIFQKYRGKVVYVDFWASWCGPCRSEMPNEEKIKKKFRDKDVIFLYLAYGDTKVNWLKARKDLSIEGGEHYLLSKSLMKDADDLFKINGIPHYVIIDKKGNIIDGNAPRPIDDKTVEDKLNLLLETK